MNQVDRIEANSCVKLLEIVLSAIVAGGETTNCKSLDLIPKLLDKISQIKVLNPSEKGILGRKMSHCSGLEYVNNILSELCSREWPHPLVVPLITSIREFQLSPDQLDLFVRKIFREAKRLELQELPPLVYQALILSCQGQRQFVLREIFQLFNNLDEKLECQRRSSSDEVMENELVQVEGTVLHHFSFAVKQDPTLGQDIFKLMKMRNSWFSPFEVALLLSLYKLQRFGAKIFEILRKAVELEFAYQNKKLSSLWISSIDELPSPTSMSSVLKSVLRRSGKGWEHIMTGFVAFSLDIISFFSDKMCIKGTQTDSGGNVLGGKIVNFCIHLLERCFRKHESVRNEVLNKIFSGIIVREGSAKHFVELFSRIAHTSFKDIVDSHAKVKDCLEYLTSLPVNIAVSLVCALQSVLFAQKSLLDFLLILLRKSLFNKDLEVRLVALEILIFIAKKSPDHSELSAHKYSKDPIAVEIVSQVRRCMTQQFQLREKLYEGFIDLVRFKPSFCDDILSILIPQLKKFLAFDTGGNVKELCVKLCIDEGSGKIVEPVSRLIAATAFCACSVVREAVTESVCAARNILEQLAVWLSSTEFEVESLDKTELENACALNRTKLMCGVCKEVFEYLLTGQVVENERFAPILTELVRLYNAVNEGLKSTKGRKGAQVEDSFLFVTPQSTAIFIGGGIRCDDKFQKHASEHVDFIAMLLQMSSKQLSIMKTTLQTCASDQRCHLWHQMKLLISSLAKCCLSGMNDDRDTFPIRSSKSISDIAFELFESTFSTACIFFSQNEISELCEDLLSGVLTFKEGEVAEKFQSPINGCIQRFLQEVEKYEGLADFDRVRQTLNLIIPILNILPQEDFLEHSEWFRHNCLRKRFQSSVVIKILISTYLRMTANEETLDTALTLANDIRGHVGKIDSEEASQTESEINHNIVAEEAVVPIVCCLADSIKICCEDIDWALSYLDRSVRKTFIDDRDSDCPENVELVRTFRTIEEKIYNRLASVLSILCTIATCDLETFPSTHEVLLTTMARTYKTVEITSKRFLVHKGKPSKSYSSLIQIIGTKLNEFMYSTVFRYVKSQENAATRAQINKEQKLVPTLIYHVECLEANLIKISKQSKVDLMRNFKRSAARDFKIDFAAVTHKLTEGADGPGESKKSKKRSKRSLAQDSSDTVTKRKRARKNDLADQPGSGEL